MFAAAIRPARPIRVAVADDCILIRHALAEILGAADEVELVAVCADADELRAAVAAHAPDVVITDIRMPPTMTDDGIRVADELRRTRPEIGVIVLSAYCEPWYAVALLRHGSDRRAYLLKGRLASVPQLLATITAVASGGSLVDAELTRVLGLGDQVT
ncbi:response regulator transcription factor [Capillimicrobium parvum]|uniref:Oxygen regulatory protein NreC n=1 Tax=Capillimicrobium parvum TaxID=2884022 RepID=A0A9E6Y1A0_9ACTN|nr:response regulator transcription factor [Capillimicrobium parvum]UGS37792.1 Oxygen regulatory protein NreC [Capillimicrobium parvum]